MSKCNRCNLNIVDDTLMCPLCNGILVMDKDMSNQPEAEELEMYQSKSLMYPDVKPAMKRMNFAIKLFIFFSVVVEAVLILINYLTYNGVKWSMICGVALMYACFTLVYSFKHNRSHRNKMIVQAMGAMVLCVLIDVALGYTGWSVDYALPIIIMVLDVLIIVLMFINIDNWQNYIMAQVGLLVLSLVFLVLFFVGIVTRPLLTIIAVAVTAFMLGATVVFGDKKATTELSRRFRV